MPAHTIDFYIDVISHNAYLAWHEMPALCARHDADFVTHPVVFGALLRAYGQLGPAEVPAKSAWMIRDVLRKARQREIEINAPAVHPFNPLMALRAIAAQDDEAGRRAVTDAIFRAVWVDGRDVSQPEQLAAVLDTAGFDGADLLGAGRQPPVKAALRANTDAALARGVFGVPSMWVGGELFWGFDDFAALEAHLAGAPPLDGAALESWYAVPAGVQRKR